MAASRVALRLVPAASILFFFIFFVSSVMARDFLLSGESLQSGQSLDNGPYSFIMQRDCNLVLYDDGEPIWATGSAGLGSDCRCTLESTGNLCLLDGNNNVLGCWYKDGPIGYYVLLLLDDGKLVTYGPRTWPIETNNIGKGISFIKEGNRLPA